MTFRPATPEELASALRSANEARTPVARVDLSALTRVLEHTPEDMTVTVEAGCTLGALQRTLAARGQWLPIDPPHANALTLATLLDEKLGGPRHCGFGTIRDWLIGLRVALADGRLIRNGGKVVKNVAGYDLMKLFVGARGTLGVIVEATFKLLPLPEAEAFVQARCESLDPAERLITAVLGSELTPTVFDLHNGHLADSRTTFRPLPLGGGEGRGERAAFTPQLHLVLGFSGPRAAVDWQLALARKLGFTEPATLDHDAQFHASGPPPHRLSVLPSCLVETLRSLGETLFVARAANGIIHHRAEGRAGRHPGAPVLKLTQHVKDTFDPNHIFPSLPL